MLVASFNKFTYPANCISKGFAEHGVNWVFEQKKGEDLGVFWVYFCLLSAQYAPIPIMTATTTAAKMTTSVVGKGASPLGSSDVGGAVVGASDVGGAVVGGAVVGGAVVGGAVVGGAVVGGSVSGSAAEGAGPTVTKVESPELP
jgi:hypothetical protein